jgi:hypothetical protein
MLAVYGKKVSRIPESYVSCTEETFLKLDWQVIRKKFPYISVY